MRRHAVLLLLVACTGCRAIDRRDATPFLVDNARLLTPAQAARIEEYHRQLLADLDVHFAIVTLDAPAASIERTAEKLFADYAVGSRTRGARGLLLVVDPVKGQTRIETGYDLEAAFPDGFVGYIQREQMGPYYAAGQPADGVVAAVELLVGRLMASPDARVPSQIAEKPVYLSGGGGANAQPAAVAESLATAQDTSGRFGAQPSAAAAFETYLAVLAAGNRSPQLGIYASETRRMLSQRIVTPAQQRNELAAIRAVESSRTMTVDGSLAVIRFPASREVPPYFLRREADGWTIDLAAAARIIGFDQLNRWYVRDPKSEFAFGL